MKKSLDSKEFQLGVCYYPEHWPESLWADDYRRMREMGFSIIRVAEFAWSIFEPEEGRFQFDLFDRAIDLAHQYGIKVIVGTPTATPPAWLTHKYPEVLNASQSGIPYRHGQRRHYNYNSPKYIELSARIVRKLAEHYKDHPAVVGWQIDNELNCEVNVFYSEADHTAFRKWVQEKYGTLEQLNQAWGTVFWSQTYTAWEQVYLTKPTVGNSPNPHHALDEKRFFSDSAISYAKMQSEIIRECAPNHWITTNGIFGHLDSHKLTGDCLDFISYDSYPNFTTISSEGGEQPLKDRRWSCNLSKARDISPNFCVMEQQSGPGGWVNRIEQPSPKPGQMRLWTYQSVAHGADMLLYFRWRTATVGTEIYWHGINDYHNRPNRRVEEAQKIGKELGAVGGRLAGTKYRAEAAILRDYDNEWDGEFDNWHGKYEQKSVMEWYKAFQYKHIPVDLLTVLEKTGLQDLCKYKLLVYPHPTILSDKTAKLLKEYVDQGGRILFGCRTGYKNSFGHCYMMPFPGPVADLCGITVEDFTRIGPYETAPSIRWMEGNSAEMFTADDFNDILHVEADTARVLAAYAGGYYEGKPALVMNTFGKGTAYYYGAVFNLGLARALLDRMGMVSPTAGWLSLPEDVELCIRENSATGEKYNILLNYSEKPQTITLFKEAVELLSGCVMHDKVEMGPYEVYILKA